MLLPSWIKRVFENGKDSVKKQAMDDQKPLRIGNICYICYGA